MACSPGADPPESVTVVRRTTWVGVPPVESISTSSGASCPVTTAPSSWGGMGSPGAMAPTSGLALGAGVEPAEVRLERRRLEGERAGRLGEGHRGVHQVHRAHGRLVLLEGQPLRLQRLRRRGRVVGGLPRS